MPSAMLLLLQAVTASAGGDQPQAHAEMGPVLPVPRTRRTIDLDVADAGRVDCKASETGEIVVCADREGADRYRLQPLPEERYAEAPPRAETTLFGKVRTSADLDSETMPQGQISNRLMLRFMLPF